MLSSDEVQVPSTSVQACNLSMHWLPERMQPVSATDEVQFPSKNVQAAVPLTL